MSSRARLTLVSAVVLLVAGYWICTLLISQETRIRREIAAMVEGFNVPDVGDATAALAESFELVNSRGDELLDKQKLQNILRQMVLGSRDPETNRFDFSVEVPDESIEVVFASDEEKLASVRLRVLLSRARDGKKAAWPVDLQVTFARMDDGWRAHLATYDLVGGRFPFRL